MHCVTEIKIQIATDEHLEEICEFVKEHFMKDDPIHSEVLKKIDPKNVDYDSLIRVPLFKKIPQGLSLIATNASGELIGLIENVEYLQNSNDVNPDSVTSEIFDVLADIELMLDDSQQCRVKEMEIRVLVVHRNWRTRGIGMKLVTDTVKLARNEGFQQIRVSCSSAYSTKTFQKCGFQLICSLRYDQLKSAGKLSFLPKAPHTHATGLILKLR